MNTTKFYKKIIFLLALIINSSLLLSQNENGYFNGILVYEHFDEYLGDSDYYREWMELVKKDSTVIEIFDDVYFESISYKGIDTLIMAFQNKESTYSEFLDGKRINFNTYGSMEYILKEKIDQSKNILGYQCQQYIYESESGNTIKECWISDLNGDISKFKNEKYFNQYFTEEGLILEFKQTHFSDKFGETITTKKIKRIKTEL